jgi:mRNA-degrading endonuclease RelE of RelBE toxin-antitoxin system
MARYRVRIPPAEAEMLRTLPPPVKAIIRRALDRIADDPAVGKPLTGLLRGYWSHRVGKYRVIYRSDEVAKEILLLHVGKRRTVYVEAEHVLSEDEGGRPGR